MVRDPRHAVAMRNVALVGVLVVTTAVGGAAAQPSGARPPAGAASSQPAPAVVLASVAQHYANAPQMTARFRETVTSATSGTTTTTADGKLYVARPAQLRLDYHRKVRTHVTTTRTEIVDGPTAWLVDHGSRQIVQAPAQTSPLPAALAFLLGGGTLGAQFDVALDASGTIGGAGATVLALTPTQPSAAYAKLYFVVDPSSGRVTESVVIDTRGDTRSFAFQAANLTSPVSAHWFQVNPSSLPRYTLVIAGAQGSGAGTAPPAALTPIGAGSTAPATP